MPSVRLPRLTLFSEAGNGWNVVRSDQLITIEKYEMLTSGVALLDTVKLLGWSPRESSKLYLETIDDMAYFCRW